MKFAAVQFRAKPREVAANLDHAATFALQAADASADVLLFPELFNTGYLIGPELFELWEPDDGRTVTWMQELASRHGMIVAGTIPERLDDRLYNTMFIIEPDGPRHRYTKRKPNKPESSAFDAGADPNIVQTSAGRAGCVVCADLNWKASLLRPMAGHIDFLLCPQAATAPRRLARSAVERERKRGKPWFGPLAEALGAPIITAGLVGEAQRFSRLLHLYFYGGTWIVDAEGNGVASVGFDEEGLAIADVAVASGAGDPDSSLFRDPGLKHRLESLLLVDYGDLRPKSSITNPRKPDGG